MARGIEARFGLGGKVAVVTGAAQGLGKAIATCFAEAGAAVAVQDLREAGAAEVARSIAGAGGRAIAVGGDAADPDVLRGLFERAQRELGGFDVLVNNAGIYPFSKMLEMPVDEWDRVIALNLRGTFLATQIGGGMMAAAGKGGRIINLASVQGIRPTAPGIAHYNASKAAVIMLTKSAALELGPMGIGVNAMAPGVIETPGTSPLIAEGGLGDPKDLVPLGGRWGRPEEVADVALFLAAPASAYITGETIVVDAGFLLQ
ncbi:MAG: SDR family oxidoreductase [Deltaproteobacteria bacterium]|nr:SDR family oxidoreductase [Deltaproteobacteria bacterium]